MAGPTKPEASGSELDEGSSPSESNPLVSGTPEEEEGSSVITHVFRPKGKAQTWTLCFTIFNCCVGSGMLAIPNIVATNGLVISAVYDLVSFVFCMVFFMYMADANYHGAYATAPELARKTWGKAFAWALDISILFCIIPVTYVTIASDYIRVGLIDLLDLPLDEGVWPWLFKVLMAVFVMFPLTLLKTITALNTVSTFTLVFAVTAFIALNVRFIQWLVTGKLNGIDHRMPPVPWWPAENSIPRVIANFTIFLSLYSVHASLTPIQKDLNGSPKERRKSVKISLALTLPLVAVMYVVAAVEGAIMFDRSCPPDGEDPGCIPIDGNILLAFKNDTAMIVIRILYSIVIMTSYPVMLYPIRANIMSWFHIDKNTRRGYGWFVLIGFLLVFLCSLLAILISDIGEVLTLLSNVFGVVCFELILVFTAMKLPLVRQRSFGDAVEAALASGEGVERTKGTLSNDKRPKKGGRAAKKEKLVDLVKVTVRVPDNDVSKEKLQASKCAWGWFYIACVVLCSINVAATVCEIIDAFY